MQDRAAIYTRAVGKMRESEGRLHGDKETCNKSKKRDDTVKENGEREEWLDCV